MAGKGSQQSPHTWRGLPAIPEHPMAVSHPGPRTQCRATWPLTRQCWQLGRRLGFGHEAFSVHHGWTSDMPLSGAPQQDSSLRGPSKSPKASFVHATHPPQMCLRCDSPTSCVYSLCRQIGENASVLPSAVRGSPSWEFMLQIPWRASTAPSGAPCLSFPSPFPHILSPAPFPLLPSPSRGVEHLPVGAPSLFTSRWAGWRRVSPPAPSPLNWPATVLRPPLTTAERLGTRVSPGRESPLCVPPQLWSLTVSLPRSLGGPLSLTYQELSLVNSLGQGFYAFNPRLLLSWSQCK